MTKNFFTISLLDNRYPALHGLRAIMILMTAQMHVTLHVALVIYLGGSEMLTDLFRYSLNTGWQTMDLFFVMSGFLIGRILFYSYDTQKNIALRFYFRRAIRTIPLYIISLLLLWGVVQFWPEASVSKVTSINWFAELFYLTNYMKDKSILAPWSWSLSVEEHFYLVGPWIVLFIYKLKNHITRVSVLCVIGFSAVAMRYWKYASTEDSAINIFKDLFIPTHMRYDTFIWGILAAYLAYKFQNKITLFYNKKYLHLIAWLIVLVISIFFLHPGINDIPFMYLSYGGTETDETVRRVALQGVWNFGLISSLLFFILIQLMTSTHSMIVKFLSLPIFRYTATLSYGFYLVHLPVAKLVTHKGIALFPTMSNSPIFFWIICFLTTSFISYFISYILHLIVEKPLLSIRDRHFP